MNDPTLRSNGSSVSYTHDGKAANTYISWEANGESGNSVRKANGEFLTAEGWKVAEKLYEQADAFPPDGEIFLMSTGGAVSEDWLRGDTANVGTKWTDFFGIIDSTLRYKAPHFDFPVAITTYEFRLIYTNKHRLVGKNGSTIREVDGPWNGK